MKAKHPLLIIAVMLMSTITACVVNKKAVYVGKNESKKVSIIRDESGKKLFFVANTAPGEFRIFKFGGNLRVVISGWDGVEAKHLTIWKKLNGDKWVGIFTTNISTLDTIGEKATTFAVLYPIILQNFPKTDLERTRKVFESALSFMEEVRRREPTPLQSYQETGDSLTINVNLDWQIVIKRWRKEKSDITISLKKRQENAWRILSTYDFWLEKLSLPQGSRAQNISGSFPRRLLLEHYIEKIIEAAKAEQEAEDVINSALKLWLSIIESQKYK